MTDLNDLNDKREWMTPRCLEKIELHHKIHQEVQNRNLNALIQYCNNGRRCTVIGYIMHEGDLDLLKSLYNSGIQITSSDILKAAFEGQHHIYKWGYDLGLPYLPPTMTDKRYEVGHRHVPYNKNDKFDII